MTEEIEPPKPVITDTTTIYQFTLAQTQAAPIRGKGLEAHVTAAAARAVAAGVF